MPKIKEVTVSHSIGVKCNMGTVKNPHGTGRTSSFESSDGHWSTSEVYDVSDLTDSEVQDFVVKTRERIMKELDDVAGEFHNTYSGFYEKNGF